MKPATGTVTVSGTPEQIKEQLAALGIQQGADGKLKGRITFQAVKHGLCARCQGAWWDRNALPPTPPKGVHLCRCEQWSGKDTDLGTIADSGPTGIRRPFWLLSQALRRRFA